MAKLGSFAVSKKQLFLNVIAHFLPIFVKKNFWPFQKFISSSCNRSNIKENV